MTGIRSIWLVPAALLLFVSGCAPKSNEAPPMQGGVYVAKGICFGEGGCYRHWRASNPVDIRKDVGPASPVIATVQPDEWVEAVDGELRLVPLRGVVHTATKTPPLAVGDVVYMLEPLGEGAYVLWHKGTTTEHTWLEGDADEPITWDKPLPAQAGVVTGWWVKLKLADGRTGWVQDPSFECMGPLQGSSNCRD